MFSEKYFKYFIVFVSLKILVKIKNIFYWSFFFEKCDKKFYFKNFDKFFYKIHNIASSNRVILRYSWSTENGASSSHIHGGVCLLNSWWDLSWMWEERASFHYTAELSKNFPFQSSGYVNSEVADISNLAVRANGLDQWLRWLSYQFL